MGNLLTAQVSIEGIRPILWHAFGPDALPLTKQERAGVAGNDPTEWKRTVLMTAERQLYIKPPYIFGCIREGGRNIARKRGTLLPIISGTLQVRDSVILIDDRFVPEEHELTSDPEQPVYLDICGVRNPATKARNVRYRIAASPGWQASFNIMWDRTVVSRDEMREVIMFAGQLVGLGDGRSIGSGRFVVNSFEVEDA